MHNLVRITQNGATVRQIESAPPCAMTALTDTQHFAYAHADIMPVCDDHAALTRSEREWLFVKPDLLIVFDRVATSGANTQRVWTLNTPLTPTISVRFSNAAPGGVLTLRDASGAVLYDGALPSGVNAPPLFGAARKTHNAALAGGVVPARHITR